jgi:hypothetical protein
VIQCPEDTASLNLERNQLEYAVNGSFQDVLRYKVTSDESIGYNFADL